MKKYFIISLLLSACHFFSYSQIPTAQTRSLYVGQPVEEYKELAKAQREKALRENDAKIRSAINKFLDYEESAYHQLDKKDISNSDFEGFLFYYDKCDKSYTDCIFFNNQGDIHPLSEMVEKKMCELNYMAGYCYLSLSKLKESKEVLSLCKDHYESIKLLKTVSDVELNQTH